MDEAFQPLYAIVRQMLDFRGQIADEDAGVRTWIYECSLESPLELDLSRDKMGRLEIGTTPPLYYVDTSIRPVYGQIRLTAEAARGHHGN